MYLTDAQAKNVMKHVSFTDDLKNALKIITQSFDSQSHGNIPTEEENDCESYTGITIVRKAHQRFADEILEENIVNGDDDNDESMSGDAANNYIHQPQNETRAELEANIERYLEEKGLSQDKSLAVNVMKQHFMSMFEGLTDGYKAPVLLVTGGPGVGKSFLVDIFDGVSKMVKAGKQLRMALYGVAAVNIDGTSLMALMNIPTEDRNFNPKRIDKWDEEKLRAFKNKYDLDNISVIVIDEISTVKAYHLAYLNARLQQACCCDKPFGGKAVVLLGDFDQLPPVCGKSIPEIAMLIEQERCSSGGGNIRRMPHSKKHFEITSVVRQGVQLFTDAKHINLTEQHRSEDQEHTDLLLKMSSGANLCPDDLKDYKLLSSEDRDFEFATILTPGNRERHEFNSIQSQRWALKKKTNVIRWRKKIRKWRGKPSIPDNEKRLIDQESCFWELFIPEALAYLTCNLNVDKGLANGVAVKYDSMSFSAEEDREKLENLLSTASPGETITLDKPPDYINVELFPDFDWDDEKIKQKNQEKRNQWKFGSMVPDKSRIVIPVSVNCSKHQRNQYKNSDIRGAGGRFQVWPSKAEFADHFPLEPGFSVTIHKAQVRFILFSMQFFNVHPLTLCIHNWLFRIYRGGQFKGLSFPFLSMR